MTEHEYHLLEVLGVETSIIRVTGGCINMEQYGAGEGRVRGHSWKAESPLVGFLGSVTRDKGVPDLIEAASILWDEGLRFSLMIAGPLVDLTLPEDKPWLHLVGELTEEEKHTFLAAIDLLVLPSRVDSFGIVLLEAWAYTKPVIGASVGGIRSLVDDGIDGLLVPFGEPPRLAEAIRRLLIDHPLALRLGAAGFRKVVEKYQCTHLLGEVERVYEDCTRRS
jgi:glycosyltransferase involved in cell wall biosynthesis